MCFENPFTAGVASFCLFVCLPVCLEEARILVNAVFKGFKTYVQGWLWGPKPSLIEVVCGG